MCLFMCVYVYMYMALLYVDSACASTPRGLSHGEPRQYTMLHYTVPYYNVIICCTICH